MIETIDAMRAEVDEQAWAETPVWAALVAEWAADPPTRPLRLVELTDPVAGVSRGLVVPAMLDVDLMIDPNDPPVIIRSE